MLEITNDAYLEATYSGVSEKIRMSDIKVFGELTTEAGPYEEDHFIVIVLNDLRLYIFPMADVINNKKIMPYFSNIFNINLKFQLSNKTHNCSVILAPEELINYKFLNISTEVKKFTIFPKPDKIIFSLSEEVQQYILRQREL